MTRPEYGLAPRGYRLPADTRLGSVSLQVAQLARSVEFYTDVLGFRLLRQDSGVATLGAADGDALLELHELIGARPVTRRTRLGLYHFAILLPTRDALGRVIAHLQAEAVPFGSADHLVSEALYLQDPDGLGIEVYADRPREQWETRGSELRMASDPLDLDDLRHAGGGAPWTGLPTGTVVGHVHLHVGSLAEARAFYHDALGFDAMVWSYPGALFLAAGGYHHHLGLNTWAGPAAEPPGSGDARLLEWTLVLPDAIALEQAAASMQHAGASSRLDVPGLALEDPWGTRLWMTTRGLST